MATAPKQSQLRKDRDRFVGFAFAAADLLLEIDLDLKITFAAGATRGLAASPDKFVGMRLTELLADRDIAVVRRVLDNLAVGQRLTPILVSLRDDRGKVLLGAFGLPNEDDLRFLTLSSVTMPAAEAQVQARDTRTGLLSKDNFSDLAARQLELAKETDQDVSLTLLEFGNLDAIQSELGQGAIDDLMAEVGSVLRANSLSGDSAGLLDVDKYGVMHAAALTGNDIKDRIAEVGQHAIEAAGGRTKFAITSNDVDLEDAKGLSGREAAQALAYTVNRFANESADSFSIDSLKDGLKLQMDETIEKIGALKTAIDKRDFKLVYQPIVSLADFEIHHYEALTRFADGKSPFQMITFAEEIGVIEDFDLAVLNMVWEMMADPPGGSATEIAVNISARSMESDRFIHALHTLYSTDRIRRRKILFEVTESAKITDLERAARIIRDWRDNGHEVCLDDFGAGATSLEYLRIFDVDYIKLDGQYVRSMMTSERDSSILRAMGSLCGEIKIATIAEMIETAAEAKRLRSLGIGYGQGWLFGKPGEIQGGGTAPGLRRAATSR